MTTPAAERLYLAQHEHAHEGKRYAIFNPHNKHVNELPFIIGFNNGGSSGWLSAVAIAEDGKILGGHICSHEGYMRHDLGIIEGSRNDRHIDSYQKHYPDGYRMDFVSYKDVGSDERLKRAFELESATESE
jgi:hypothetical protein